MMIQKDVSFEGENVFLRTVTYHYTGRCILHSKEWIVLEDVAWIADSGRFGEFLKSGSASEVEAYPDDRTAAIPMGVVVEVVDWPHDLPRETK